MRILVTRAGAGHADAVLPIALDRLTEAAPNQFPTYAEQIVGVVDAPRRKRLADILAARRNGIVGTAKRARVDKLLTQLAK